MVLYKIIKCPTQVMNWLTPLAGLSSMLASVVFGYSRVSNKRHMTLIIFSSKIPLWRPYWRYDVYSFLWIPLVTFIFCSMFFQENPLMTGLLKVWLLFFFPGNFPYDVYYVYDAYWRLESRSDHRTGPNKGVTHTGEKHLPVPNVKSF